MGGQGERGVKSKADDGLTWRLRVISSEEDKQGRFINAGRKEM